MANVGKAALGVMATLSVVALADSYFNAAPSDRAIYSSEPQPAPASPAIMHNADGSVDCAIDLRQSKAAVSTAIKTCNDLLPSRPSTQPAYEKLPDNALS